VSGPLIGFVQNITIAAEFVLKCGVAISDEAVSDATFFRLIFGRCVIIECEIGVHDFGF